MSFPSITHTEQYEALREKLAVFSLGASAEAITPERAGFPVDRTGELDATDSLNAYFLWLFANRRKGSLGPGTFKTTGELLITGDIDDWMGLDFDGAIIQPAVGHDYHGLRIALTGSNIGLRRPAPIYDARVHGLYSGSLPTDGKAAIILDGTPLMTLYSPEAVGFDIGFDFINNCYDAAIYSPSVPRFDSCNCGINLRTGTESGSDLNFYDVQIYAAKVAINIQGGGGGYHFYGGQLLAQGSFVGNDDDLGVVILCKDYVADGSGSVVSGANQIVFNGVSWEGWRGMWAIRSFSDMIVTLDCCAFNPSASTAGQQALGLWKMEGCGAENSRVTTTGCSIAGGYFAAAYNAVCDLTGQPSFLEGLWHSAPTTCNGTLKAVGWFQTMGRNSALGPYQNTGITQWVDTSPGWPRYYLQIGYSCLVADYYYQDAAFANFRGALRVSNDSGTTIAGDPRSYPSGRTIVAWGDCDALFDNTGATAIAPFTLPATDAGAGAITGYSVSFVVLDADGIRVTAAGSDVINVAGVASAAGGKIEATTIGATVTLKCVAAGLWVATACVDPSLWTVT